MDAAINSYPCDSLISRLLARHYFWYVPSPFVSYDSWAVTGDAMRICKDCGKPENEWAWVFFPGRERVCDCQVDLSNGTLLPRGMFGFLDERMDWIGEVLSVASRDSAER